MSVSTQDMRNAWAPPCSSSRLRTIPLGVNGARISVDYRTVPAFMLLGAIMVAHDYVIRAGDTGAYNCRIITGGSGYSLHAYGIAADVNWQSNPYSSHLITNMPPAMIRDIGAIRTRGGVPVFRWGGRYSGSKDAMHFEIVATPAQLAAGLQGGTDNMPLNAEDLDKIRGIVQANNDETQEVVRTWGKAVLDYADAVAAASGVNKEKVAAKLEPKTKQFLSQVR